MRKPSEGRIKALFCTLFILSLVLSLASCINGGIELPITDQYDDVKLAQETMMSFLENLHIGQYKEAVNLFGGTYETMVEHNPGVDPTNQSALLQNACLINGAQCLQVKSVALENEVSATEYVFRVEFMNEDGSLFVAGPCCGGNETDSPTQSAFFFRVVKGDNGEFIVMDMPPYIP